LVGLCLWSLVRFQQAPRWWPLVFAYVAVVPMEGLRRYLFVGLALLIPVVVAVTPGIKTLMRARWSTIAVLASAGMLATAQTGVGLDSTLLGTFEDVRHAMAIGARTRFVDTPPVRVKEGDTFVIGGTPAPTPGAPGSESGRTLSPTTRPSVIHIAPDTRIVVVPSDATRPTPGLGTVYVHPGEIVVVGPDQRTPAPQPPVLVPDPAASTLVLVPAAARPASEMTLRTLSYLPKGLAFALLSPFPWDLESRIDLAVLPDLALWYLVLLGAVLTVVRDRRRLGLLAGPVLLVVGVIGLLSLAEGNWGTLYRHRAMVVPWATVLASVTFCRVPWHRPLARTSAPGGVAAPGG
ncbi:MAG: hypothetical protein HY553_18305, partial [Elusimicrobia bacterium]|nr:hypothetical protein [Elusimicrobiota bacterium]